MSVRSKGEEKNAVGSFSSIVIYPVKLNPFGGDLKIDKTD